MSIVNVNQSLGLPILFPFPPRRRQKTTITQTTVYPSSTPANGINTVFNMPANFVLNSGSVVALGPNETFTLFDPTALYTGNTFMISGSAGAYVASFTSAPTPNFNSLGQPVNTLLSFQVEQPVTI